MARNESSIKGVRDLDPLFSDTSFKGFGNVVHTWIVPFGDFTSSRRLSRDQFWFENLDKCEAFFKR